GRPPAQPETPSGPDYAPTPRHDVAGPAGALGFARLFYKDESARFTLRSFKALGGAYAVIRQAQAFLKTRLGETVATADIRAGRYRDALADWTVCTATDGNHGRSVAWGAQMIGCRAVIYIHAEVSAGRQQAMEGFGAEVRRIAGNYDDSVRIAAETAAEADWVVVSDTSWPGYAAIPTDVMHGYMLMADEAIDQLDGRVPSHVFLQGGVGGMAAAVAATFELRFGAKRPKIIVAEPSLAACLFATAKAGAPVTIEGDLATLMAGLAAGEVSPLAWTVLRSVADGFVYVPDGDVPPLMRRLAAPAGGDPAVEAGESALCGLAAALRIAGEAEAAAAFQLDAASEVLIFGSEGATDPTLYAELVSAA
ncbi:MAG: diaminopropionate ammonia-lyase, partial [Pseudomonadota bacterium]|nr:diaminopropionate ammonia-lyase [Pseudomonadota bacterium]